MKLTTHGTIVALSDTATGLTVLLAPDDEIKREDWLEACREHDLPEEPLAWDYTENNGWLAWAILPRVPVKLPELAATA